MLYPIFAENQAPQQLLFPQISHLALGVVENNGLWVERAVTHSTFNVIHSLIYSVKSNFGPYFYPNITVLALF